MGADRLRVNRLRDLCVRPGLDGGAETDPAPVQEAQFALMARSGVESARIVFSWRDMQPQKGGAFDFARTDAQVGAAARHGIALHELTPVRASLEEAFMTLTADEVEYHSAGTHVQEGAAA